MLIAPSTPRNCRLNRAKPGAARHAISASSPATIGSTHSPTGDRTQMATLRAITAADSHSTGRHNRGWALARINNAPTALGASGPPAAIAAKVKREASPAT